MSHSKDTHSKSKKRSLPSFLKKTYQMLQDPANHGIVRWASEGRGFLVLNEEQFTRSILPMYFKHNNYSSFVRQLNMYNFHKLRQSGIESHFYHELFTPENNGESIQYIKRKAERKKIRLENQENIVVRKKNSNPNKRLSLPLNLSSINPDSELKPLEETKSTKNGICSSIIQNPSSEKLLRFEEDEEDCISIIDGMEDKGEIQRPYLITKELILESNGNLMNFSVQQRHSMFSIGSLVLK